MQKNISPFFLWNVAEIIDSCARFLLFFICFSTDCTNFQVCSFSIAESGRYLLVICLIFCHISHPLRLSLSRKTRTWACQSKNCPPTIVLCYNNNANVQPEHRLQTNRAGTDLAGNLCSVGAHLQNSRAAAGSAYGALLQMAHVKRATTRQPKDL